VRVASNDLPPLSALENPERTFALAPGANEQIGVRLIPQRRTLRMLDRGTVR